MNLNYLKLKKINFDIDIQIKKTITSLHEGVKLGFQDLGVSNMNLGHHGHQMMIQDVF